MNRCSRVMLPVGALVVGLTIEAQASAQPPPMRLDYQAAAGCPDADAFAAEVRARAPRSSSLGGQSFKVKITSNAAAKPPTSFEGSVVITDDDGVTPSRAVHGDTCGEVVRALALTVAMTLDPEDSAPPVVIVSTVAPPASPPAEKPADAAPPPTRGGLHLSAGLRAGVESAVGPRLAPALGIYADLGLGNASLRLGAVRAVSPVIERDAGSARFFRTTVTLDGCPLRWRAATSLSLVPCGGFEIGSLTSEGRSSVDPESASRPWAALGLLGRIVWEPFAPLALELEGRATVPLTRDRFFFRPAADVFQAPIAAFSAAFTAGVRFR